MSLILSKEKAYNKLNSKVVNLNSNQLCKYLHEVYDLTLKISSFLKKDEFTGFEKQSSMIYLPKKNLNKNEINPLLWELGHISYFYDYHCLRYLIDDYQIMIPDSEIYNSFVTNRKTRFKFRDHSKKVIFHYYEYIYFTLNNYITNNILNEKTTYLILLSILHNHMHIESFLFSRKIIGFKKLITSKFKTIDINKDIEFIFINGGKFEQGTYEGENLLCFDNEKPRFSTKINDFLVSNILVTEKLVEKFILGNGYKKEDYWCDNGWRWINENKITLPLYWKKMGDNLVIKNHKFHQIVIGNNPASHLNWYEAKAICKWLGGRLPTESEWEYLATNGGTTKLPWGNNWKENVANIEYSGDVCDVSSFSSGDNKWGVRQLIGNLWEWCEEPIYPYDGFVMDSIYREMSYPFFGQKKILRGGSWAVPKILINSKYRNAQMPDTRIQFTGIRVVRDI